MARRALITQARGTRTHSTGTHTTRRKFDVTPMPERFVEPETVEDTREFQDFRSMMQGNRGVL